MPFGLWSRVGSVNHKAHARACRMTVCRERCKNGSTDQDAIWIMNLGELREPRGTY